jgi:hypothetical protein
VIALTLRVPFSVTMVMRAEDNAVRNCVRRSAPRFWRAACGCRGASPCRVRAEPAPLLLLFPANRGRWDVGVRGERDHPAIGFLSLSGGGVFASRPRPAPQRGARGGKPSATNGAQRRSVAEERRRWAARPRSGRSERARIARPGMGCGVERLWCPRRAGIERPQGASAQRDGQTGRAAATRARSEATTCGATDRPRHRV